MMKKLFYLLIITVLISSCSEYQKTLKSDDAAMKFLLGTQLYEEGKWNKAHRLFEQIMPVYRGKPQAEKLTYMHAKCSYEMRDYYIASYHFDKFADIYPDSEKAEEASYLSAKGYYFNSPVYSKEQKETIEAIQKLQLFVNAYPNSQYLAEANELVKELDFKLERKAFEIAKQYDLIKDYKASIKSFNNFLVDFPGTILREDALFYRFDAAHNLALLSVDQLKKDRIDEALGYHASLMKAFPQSKYTEQATTMIEELQNQLSDLTMVSDLATKS